MLQFVIIPLALMLSGCQMLAQRTVAPEPVQTVIIEQNKAGASVAYVALPGATSGLGAETFVISPKAYARMMGRADPQLEADIRAFSRLSKKNGGPAYALLPPALCAEEARPKRGSKTKETVCYATEEEGRVVVYMPRP